jgi:large subunit ribosomal protein L17
MRHGNNVRKFGREKNQRNALLKGLAISLIKEEQIMTTEAKAKEIRPYVEKMITKAKKGTVVVRRELSAELYNKKTIVKKLVDELGVKYQDRKGGYLRIVKLPPRLSDGARMAVIQFV